MEPEKILTSAEILKRIEKNCRRLCYDDNEADECYLFVLDGLEANDHARLRAFKGRSSANTYIYSVVHSLINDFKRRKYGRRRIPKIVTALGAWAEAVYRFICWEKHSIETAYDLVAMDDLFTGDFDEFCQSIIPIKKAPCRDNPSFVSMESRSRENQTLSVVDKDNPNPLERLLMKLDRERRKIAAQVIREVTNGLNDSDRLLVRLVYGDDLSAAAAGRSLGLSPAAARKRLKKTLTQYREKLLAAGVREP